ncbi:MAG: thiosulfate oxidation carrier protein SoxY [Halieaceae bacterium]|jgi:sulfur-oxidizing protein SoxY|nr:thiosulfate oxidation carrier protein SoxY [Halieaceae bacterium]
MMRGSGGPTKPSRRLWLRRAAGLSLLTLLPRELMATPQEMREAMTAVFGDRPITPGRVQIGLPALAENGNSVRLSVSVDSPMTTEEYVDFIQLFSPENPRPDVARFELSPASGLAQVETRIRISAEQDIVAVAGLSDGSLWSGSAHIVVTEAACIDALI